MDDTAVDVRAGGGRRRGHPGPRPVVRRGAGRAGRPGLRRAVGPGPGVGGRRGPDRPGWPPLLPDGLRAPPRRTTGASARRPTRPSAWSRGPPSSSCATTTAPRTPTPSTCWWRSRSGPTPAWSRPRWSAGTTPTVLLHVGMSADKTRGGGRAGPGRRGRPRPARRRARRVRGAGRLHPGPGRPVRPSWAGSTRRSWPWARTSTSAGGPRWPGPGWWWPPTPGSATSRPWPAGCGPWPPDAGGSRAAHPPGAPAPPRAAGRPQVLLGPFHLARVLPQAALLAAGEVVVALVVARPGPGPGRGRGVALEPAPARASCGAAAREVKAHRVFDRRRGPPPPAAGQRPADHLPARASPTRGSTWPTAASRPPPWWSWPATSWAVPSRCSPGASGRPSPRTPTSTSSTTSATVRGGTGSARRRRRPVLTSHRSRLVAAAGGGGGAGGGVARPVRRRPAPGGPVRAHAELDRHLASPGDRVAVGGGGDHRPVHPGLRGAGRPGHGAARGHGAPAEGGRARLHPPRGLGCLPAAAPAAPRRGRAWWPPCATSGSRCAYDELAQGRLGRPGGLRRRRRGSSPGWPGPAGCRPTVRGSPEEAVAGWRLDPARPDAHARRRRGGGGRLRPGGGGGGPGLCARGHGGLGPGGRVAAERAGAGRGRRGHRGGRRALRALGAWARCSPAAPPCRSSAWPGRRPRPRRGATCSASPWARPAPAPSAGCWSPRPSCRCSSAASPAWPGPAGSRRSPSSPGSWPWPWPRAGRAASPPPSTCCWPRRPPRWPAGVGLGVASFEIDLAGYRFGWRQVATGLALVAAVVGLLPVVADAGDGRWGLADTGFAQAARLAAGSGARPGRSRVLWLGDPRALPVGAWSVSAGLAYATTEVGHPRRGDAVGPGLAGAGRRRGRRRAPGPAGPHRPPGPAPRPRRRALRGGDRGARPPDPRRPDIAVDAAAPRPRDVLAPAVRPGPGVDQRRGAGGLREHDRPPRAGRTDPAAARHRRAAGRVAHGPGRDRLAAGAARPRRPALLRGHGGLGHRLRLLRPRRPLAGPRPRPHGGLDAGLRLGGAVRERAGRPGHAAAGPHPAGPAGRHRRTPALAGGGRDPARPPPLARLVGGAGRRPPGPQGGRREGGAEGVPVDPPAGGAVPAADAGRSPSGAAP